MRTVFITFVFLASTAFGYNLQCQNQWQGPSSDNDIVDCIKKIPSDYPGVLVPVAIPFLLFLFLLVLYPITFCCRCCGACGSMNPRPGASCCCDGEEWDQVDDMVRTAYYPYCNVCCVKLSGVLLFILTIGVVVLLPVGAWKASSGLTYAVDHVETDILDWVVARKNEFISDLTLSNGSLISPLTNDTFKPFDEFNADAREKTDTAQNDYVSKMKTAIQVLYGVAVIPTVLVAFITVFSCFNCRRCLPACFTCFNYCFGLLFGLVGTLFMLIGIVFLLFCGEVELQNQEQPGIFQWYLVPLCEEKIFFNKFKQEMATSEQEASLSACNAMTEICGNDNSTLIGVNSYTESKQFYCPQISYPGVNLTATCVTVKFIQLVFNTSHSRQGSALCNCTLSTCPELCKDNDQLSAEVGFALPSSSPSAPNKTREAREQIAVGVQAVKGLARAFVYADCDVLLTRGVMPLDQCGDISEGLLLLGAGCSLATLCLIFGIPLLFKGQKLFFATPDQKLIDGAKDSMSSPY